MLLPPAILQRPAHLPIKVLFEAEVLKVAYSYASPEHCPAKQPTKKLFEEFIPVPVFKFVVTMFASPKLELQRANTSDPEPAEPVYPITPCEPV